MKDSRLLHITAFAYLLTFTLLAVEAPTASKLIPSGQDLISTGPMIIPKLIHLQQANGEMIAEVRLLKVTEFKVTGSSVVFNNTTGAVGADGATIELSGNDGKAITIRAPQIRAPSALEAPADPWLSNLIRLQQANGKTIAELRLPHGNPLNAPNGANIVVGNVTWKIHATDGSTVTINSQRVEFFHPTE